MATTTAALVLTRAVAAGAYVSLEAGETRTHAVDQATGRPLCGKVKPASLLDDPHATDEDAAPTCAVCLRRDPRPAATRAAVHGAALALHGLELALEPDDRLAAGRTGELRAALVAALAALDALEARRFADANRTV